MNIYARIEILKDILKRAQTVPMAPTSKATQDSQKSITPQSTQPVLQNEIQQPVVNKPQQPVSNVIQPPGSDKQNVVNPVNSTNPAATQTVPVDPTVNPRQPQTPPPQPQEKKTYALYEIVKSAIDNNKEKMLSAKQHYQLVNEIYFDGLQNKTVAYLHPNNIMTTSNKCNKNEFVKSGAIAIYEPVIGKTKNFNIKIFCERKDLNKIHSLCKKLNKFGIDSEIYKFKNRYEIKCASDFELNSSEVLSYIKSESDLNMNLDELKPGKLKRISFSLDENGESGTIIRIESIIFD